MRKEEVNVNSKLYLSIIIVSIFIFTILFSNVNLQMTGNTISENQPDSILGKDTYIREGLDANFATTENLRVGKIISGVEHRALLEFNFTEVPSTDTILEANLELNLISTSNKNSLEVELYRIVSPWEETEATWFKRTTSDWISVGADYGEKMGEATIPAEPGLHQILVTDMVRKWIDGSRLNYGFIIIPKNASNGDYFDFGTSNSETTTERPKITINHMSNAPPLINKVTTDSALSNPKKINEIITFQVNWSDMESDDAKIFICNKNDTTSSGCSDKTYCQTNLSSANPISCSYEISENENKITDFWTTICDEGGCSIPEESQFFTNHAPTVEVINPNGGEKINQSQGNYSIEFEVFDKDLDDLVGGIYYGETEEDTSEIINSNVNFSKYCQDIDYDPKTPLECIYPWDSTGAYGTYFLTIQVNDTYENSKDSSDSSFSITSLIDIGAPIINADWLSDTQITSGKEITLNANIEDINIKNVWATINTIPITRIELENNGGNNYSSDWIAEKIGIYSYIIYAIDKVGNTNNTQEKFFEIKKPTLTPILQTLPEVAMPNHIIQITATSKSTEKIKGVHAFLTVPEGFTFLKDYPQNSDLENFTINETKIATWILSVPLNENTYELSISYSDEFQNTWNSEKFDIEVSSSYSVYELELEGYPEVETSNDYYTKSTFKQNNQNIDPDSMEISLYDPANQLTIGPTTMTKTKTGEYNFTYLVGASSTEGQWETIVNATKNGISYYKNQFWKLVGGPFDVRDIRVDNFKNDELQISVTTENTGGANKDMILVWNLTRMDTGEMLDSAAETFMVPANSEKNWTINPTINYTGSVKITMLGYYGFDFSEKAGGYKIFSTTEGDSVSPPSSSSGGSSRDSALDEDLKNSDLEIFTEKTILLTSGEEKIVSLRVKNTGETKLTNIIVSIEGIPSSDYLITPASKGSLNSGEETTFDIKFLTEDNFKNKYFNYVVQSNEITKKVTGELQVIDVEQYLEDKINILKQKIASLNELFQDNPIIGELTNCEYIVKDAEISISNKNFPEAKKQIENGENCVTEVATKIKPSNSSSPAQYVLWIITWTLIIALIIIIYLLIKRLSVMSTIRKINIQKPSYPSKPESFDNRIKSIEDRVNNLEY